MSKKLKIFTLLLSLSLSGFAQEQLSLQEAITIALQNNYDIKINKNQVDIAKNNANIGNAGMLPNLTGSYTNGGSIQNTRQTPATGPDRVITGAKSTNNSYGADLNWTIFDGFSMFANYDRLKELQKQGELNARLTILTTVADVITAYYDIVRQQQLVIAADSAMDVSVLRTNIAKTKLQLGRGSKLDVLTAQVDYNTDTSNYLQTKNALQVAKVRLNQLMVRDIGTSFSVINNIDVDKGILFSKMAEMAEQQNPNVQNAFINQRIASLTLKSVRGARYPSISLNSGYSRANSTSPTGFNQKFAANGLTYGVTASLNLFNGFLQRQQERNAKIEIDNSILNLNKTKLDVNAQLLTAYQNYSTYLDLIKLEQRNVDIAKENLDITLAKYRLGSIAPLELREAQRNAIDAQNRFIEMQYQAKIAETTLKEISGNINLSN
ncbi:MULTISPECIES: TolC family protein [unclassified Pedobacter]|uniref:TolC family protein n=1 Tax=unclassified Pedobacter TaxID=2628915 RepID=UPI001DBABB69|nr:MULTISPECIES: TolC family protein [unclassified Pedobacter]CAH0239447.1 Toluene efflux pump outer membrane protein TtgC [Pedobacter sp. Bi36]CAH0265570.1 Toluene efflux pump outer membrane protein TtgC [Pedobacter sp. Bi126]